MKEFLSRHGRTFTERNVEEDPAAYAELLARGWRRVPVTVIGDHIVPGFDPAALAEALSRLA